MLDSIDTIFAALANPTRRELLRLLREEGEQSVQSLAAHFAMQRPSLSEHLKVLREVGLVSEQRRGRQRYYNDSRKRSILSIHPMPCIRLFPFGKHEPLSSLTMSTPVYANLLLM
ncbi:hypothetical protein KSF_085110 [Reticulibacter mediterranei]|uniref:HTH arsR-type domain-containing protein n=1 Tax=Reticulibacter mediterranei TaxID=2778369 RepID=A0A8J3IQN9_9CHLR|nr:metalloregulator ArsR/SmtB family transcription factor [Reticulibacter mediterranei]GHO98463.1 hypothetical protein KSF_085110 [Reticulibacter mediterranei]